MFNYRKKNVSCFDIGEVPKHLGKQNWDWLSFFAIHFHFRTMWVGEFFHSDRKNSNVISDHHLFVSVYWFYLKGIKTNIITFLLAS